MAAENIYGRNAWQQPWNLRSVIKEIEVVGKGQLKHGCRV